MSSKDMVLSVLRSQGTTDALDLRGRAAGMDGTGIIEEENKVPDWSGEKDYSQWSAGAPVRYGGQVYKLITPHNAAHYPDTSPAGLPSLWSITHTKDPAKAKPWMPPNGTSGLYEQGECCTDPDTGDWGAVWRSKVDGNAFSPSAYAQNWERVTLFE